MSAAVDRIVRELARDETRRANFLTYGTWQGDPLPRDLIVEIETALAVGGRHLAAVPDSVPSSWAPIDLAPILAGDHVREAPSVLIRDDGAALLYRGRIAELAGEPEAGKGWVALAATAERLIMGESVVYVDAETDAPAILQRLRDLGLSVNVIAANFRYVRPEGPLDWDALDSAFMPPPALVVIDGVTAALTMAGLALTDNAEVAGWIEALPRRVARETGAAVLLVDHLVKDREARGRYAIGAQHKLAAVDVAFRLDVLDPAGRGMTGRSKLRVVKDRPGSVRALAADADREHVATIVFDSDGDDGGIAVRIEPPSDAPAEFRPTRLMERLSCAIEATPGLSQRQCRDDVRGATDAKRLGLAILLREGFIRAEKDGQATRHYSVRPYREADETDADEPTGPTGPRPVRDRSGGPLEVTGPAVRPPTGAAGTGPVTDVAVEGVTGPGSGGQSGGGLPA